MDRTADALKRIDAGSLVAIFQNTPGRVEQPVVQCVQIKPMQTAQGAVDRYRIVFSDTKNYVQTMLATSANEEIDSGRLTRGVLVRLLGYQANNVKGKRILIVTSIQVITEYGALEKLGNPVALDIKDDAQPNTIGANGFYGQQPQQQPQQQQQQQQQRSMPSHTKGVSSSAHANIYPIEALSPYSHKWTIKARCTSKSDIKTWHNRNGEGKLFSVNLLDDSGEIRATGFNDQCDQLYELFQENNVYYISSPCRVQLAKKQFSNVNNDYELTFERDTVVEKAEEQEGVPQVRFNFTTIADLQSVDKDTTIDIVGILKDVGETSEITSKTTGKPYEKRELTLVDDTGYSVRLTIWGKTAQSFDAAPDTVVAFKGVKVSDFGGRSLSLLSSGSMTVNPDMPESHRLRGWYDDSGQAQQTFQTHANVQGTVVPGERKKDQNKTIAAVKEEELGMSENPDYFSMTASIQFIKPKNFCYAACLNEGCNKKVEQYEDQWRCERCNVSHDKPQYRYILSINPSDHTDSLWCTAFDKEANLIMGRSADELKELESSGETEKLNDAFSEANYRTWNWRIRAKMDQFQDEQRVRYQVMSVTPLNFVQESQKMMDLIKQYENAGLN